jgi:hypothetical protein
VGVGECSGDGWVDMGVDEVSGELIKIYFEVESVVNAECNWNCPAYLHQSSAKPRDHFTKALYIIISHPFATRKCPPLVEWSSQTGRRIWVRISTN